MKLSNVLPLIAGGQKCQTLAVSWNPCNLGIYHRLQSVLAAVQFRSAKLDNI